MTFTESDYMDRDPYRKLTVGLAHAFGGALLITAGFPMWLVVGGYFIKELVFDLSRIVMSDRSKWLSHIWADRWLVADSIIDWIFWYLGAAMVLHSDWRYGFAVLVVGTAYFVASKRYDSR